MIAPLSRRDLLVSGLAAGLPVYTSCHSDGAEARPNRMRASSEDRPVAATVRAQATRDGAGVTLMRSLGAPALTTLDPFLLLDEFKTERAEDYIAGFPEHPHRGFETVTYMIHGAMEHRDTLGNQGRLGPGSAQWMTAGRGIVHSEMPKQQSGLMWGFQLWVNLPAKLKMTKPRYQDLAAEQIPELASGDAQLKVVAGRIRGRSGPVAGIAQAPLLVDVLLPPGGALREPLPAGHTVIAYVTAGEVALGRDQTPVRAAELAVMGAGSTFAVRTAQGARVLVIAARPTREPVARSGPFVMNTQEELRQAWHDYRTGRLLGG